MARPSIEEKLRNEVAKYIDEVKGSKPLDRPLSVRAVAKAISRDPRVIKKYRLDLLIEDASKIRNRNHRSRTDALIEGLKKELDVAKADVERLKTELHANLARLALVEANAKRYDGLNPEDLYKPIVPPDRSRPGSMRRRGFRIV